MQQRVCVRSRLFEVDHEHLILIIFLLVCKYPLRLVDFIIGQKIISFLAIYITSSAFGCVTYTPKLISLSYTRKSFPLARDT